MSAVEFARRSGLKYSTLAGWRHRHRRSHRPGRLRPVRLLEAVLPSASLTALPALPVLLPGGARLEIACAAQLTAGGRLAPRTGEARRRMLSFSGSLKVFVALEPADSKRSVKCQGAVARSLAKVRV